MSRSAGGRLPALALVAVLLLAGCGGVSSGGLPAETLTPAPVPEPATDSPTPTGVATPSRTLTPDGVVPGLGPRGAVADRFALVRAHVERVTRASYTLRQVTTVRYRNGSLRSRQVVTARVATGGNRFTLTDDVSGPAAGRVRSPPGRFELWTDGERFVSRFQPPDGPPEYARAGPEEYARQRQYYSPPPDRGTLLATLSAFALERPATASPTGDGPPSTGTVGSPPGTATTDGGTPRPVPARNDTVTPSVDGRPVRVVGRDLINPEALAAAGPGTDIRNASLTMTVDPRGHIRSYDLSYSAVIAGERVRVRRRSRYEVGGVEVDRPAWYTAAVNATGGTDTPAAVGK